MQVLVYGAADRDRTGTLFPARDFKSLVSAYSTTAAGIGRPGGAAKIIRNYRFALSEANRRVFLRFTEEIRRPS